MRHNVGSTERIARIAVGAVAGTAAFMAPRGWQRAALGAVAASGIATGLSRYCPVNQAMGIEDPESGMLGEQMYRDGELRRDISTREALGQPPSAGASTPQMTRAGDAFGSAGS